MRKILIFVAMIAALPGCTQRAPDEEQAGVEDESAGKGVDRSRAGKPAPATAFNDPAGKPTSLAAFTGRPLLVNLWATWCAPCVKELPMLDALATAARADGLRVVAISQDSGPAPSVAAFLEDKGIATLVPYHDPKMAMSGALGAEVLPTSILFDAQGRELWRYVGDLDWTGAEATKLLGEAAAR